MATQTGSIDLKAQKAAADIGLEVDQHFWYDSIGAHVTEVTQEEWNDISDPNYHSGGNLLAKSTGIAVRDGMTELATFGASGAVIGRNADGKNRIELTNSGLELITVISGIDVVIAHIGQNYYTFGSRVGGEPTGFASFAEGQNTVASGDYSHSEGLYTKATNDASHAGGNRSKANGYCSFVHGMTLTSNYDYQTVIGKNNDNNSNNAFEIGNGVGANSNALTVDWSGNVVAAGGLTLYNNKAVADFVVEKGTDSGWEYQKWYSGRVEAIYNGSITYSATSSSGQLYRSVSNTLAIPNGIFSATPQFVTIGINLNSTVLIGAVGLATSTTNIGFQVWRSTNTNTSTSTTATVRATYVP